MDAVCLQIVDAEGSVKAWVDASEPGTGNWLKYVRSCSELQQRNVRAIQNKDEIFYTASKDIDVSQELLLFNDDAVVPEIQGKYSMDHHLVCNTLTNTYVDLSHIGTLM